MRKGKLRYLQLLLKEEIIEGRPDYRTQSKLHPALELLGALEWIGSAPFRIRIR